MPRLLSGNIDRIDEAAPAFKAVDQSHNEEKQSIRTRGRNSATAFLIDWLEKRTGLDSIVGIGHRVVHGGPKFSAPARVTPALLAELRRISPYDPEHLPAEIEMMEAFRHKRSRLPQVACFDTAFHHDMPAVAKLLPIPRRFFDKGIRRYGFHGLSYTYLIEELERLAGRKAARGRVVLAHLGNGASLAAVRDGKCIDTSMAFTPTAGVPMSTRSGDLDPGLVWYLTRTEKMGAFQFHKMANRDSGLLGVSGISSDMRDLLSCEAKDVHAAEAIAMFCYHIKKRIGSFAAALGGLDILAFSAGIGENSARVRWDVCEGLDFLGIRLDRAANEAARPVISRKGSRVTVRVIRTDEEAVIARSVCRALGLSCAS